jgi:hypothetical protein
MRSGLKNEILHIIHLADRTDRLELLMNEIRLQQIPNRMIWEGVHIPDNPAKGILLAHQRIVAFAKNQGSEAVTIAEDDIKFSAKGAWRYYRSRQPTEFDLYLGGIIWGEISSDNTVHDFSGTSLYTISRKFYDHFLALEPGRDFDRQLAGSGNFIVCHPMVSTQYGGHSDNTGQIMDFTRYTSRYQFYKA